MREKRWLIVNADDLGLSRETNRGIFQAHKHGIVTSASLMVRQAAVADAIETSRRFPGLSLGLHVDLGEWSYRDGEWQQVYQVVAPDDLLAVKTEIQRQIELFRQLTNHRPTHLDSHQHVHHDQPLRYVFKQIARQLKIPLRGLTPRIQFCGEFYGREKTKAFPDGITVANLCRIIRELPQGVTELGCHPGLDPELNSDYRDERCQEVCTLCHPEVRSELAREAVTLISFATMPPDAN